MKQETNDRVLRVAINRDSTIGQVCSDLNNRYEEENKFTPPHEEPKNETDMASSITECKGEEAEISANPLSCTNCGKTFSRIDSRRRHESKNICQSKTKPSGREVDIDDKCIPNILESRLKCAEANDYLTKNSCENCGKTFSSLRSKLRHEKNKVCSREDLNIPKIQDCFSLETEVNNKIESETSASNLCYQCPLCTKRYEREYERNAHLMEHKI